MNGQKKVFRTRQDDKAPLDPNDYGLQKSQSSQEEQIVNLWLDKLQQGREATWLVERASESHLQDWRDPDQRGGEMQEVSWCQE